MTFLRIPVDVQSVHLFVFFEAPSKPQLGLRRCIVGLGSALPTPTLHNTVHCTLHYYLQLSSDRLVCRRTPPLCRSFLRSAQSAGEGDPNPASLQRGRLAIGCFAASRRALLLDHLHRRPQLRAPYTASRVRRDAKTGQCTHCSRSPFPSHRRFAARVVPDHERLPAARECYGVSTR